MTSPAEPGATGKKPRGAASQASAAPQSPVPSIEPPLAQTETSIAALAAAGTSEQAAQAAEKPVVVGAAEIPLEPGGPGAGAARVAEEVEGFATRPVAGSETSIAALTAGERAELEELRRLRSSGDAFAATTEPDVARVARHVEEGRRLAAGLPARQGLVVDAASVPEIRFAQAATRVLRNGRNYTAGEPVPLDFAAYTELVGIGAIVNDRWADLPMVGEA